MPVIPKSEIHQAVLFITPPGMALQQWQGHHELVHEKGRLREVANWLRDLLEHDIEPAAREEERRLADKARFELHEKSKVEYERVAAIAAQVPQRERGKVQVVIESAPRPEDRPENAAPADNVTQHLFPID